jgi:hypothetical protein
MRCDSNRLLRHSFHWRLIMKNLLAVVALGLSVLPIPMHAADSTCDAQATEKKLAGAAKTSFLKKCEADSSKNTCNTQAAEKNLAGAAKSSFVTKCVADAKAASAEAARTACDSQAAEKKLAGAAKTSFTKKCVADATK